MNKKNWYYENSVTGEITDDAWQADQWALIDHIAIICWHWSDVCGEWLDLMVREP